MSVEGGEEPNPLTEIDAKALRRTMLRDIVVVVALIGLTMFFAVRFELNETFFDWTRRFEHLQFDELPLVLLVLAVGFTWFAARRYREVGLTLKQQKIIEARLAAALVENRRLAQQYLNVQEDERRGIARELHDELGQYLNAIKVDAVSIRDSHRNEDDAARAAAIGIARSADHVYSAVADMIRRLRPVGLDELGLLAALEHYLDQWRRRSPNTEVSLAVQGDFAKLGEQANLTVYRVIQEGLTNVVKHADAKHVAIELKCDMATGEVTLKISDDGRGADLRHRPSTSGSSGFGLVSMRERVEMQGGRFEIQTSPTGGFALSARFRASQS